MTTYVVTSLLDDGSAGSLRYELAQAQSGDTITFDPSLAGDTITLNSTLTITDGVAINASGESIAISSANGELKNNGLIDVVGGLLAIDGNVTGSGLLLIETGATLELDGTTGESVTFDGIDATLELGPSSTIGSLYNLGGGDTIDLVGVDLTAVSFGTNELIGTLAGGGKLTLSTPDIDSSLQLNLVSDSSGSTISLLPSPVSAVPEIITSLGEYNIIVLSDAHVAAGQFDEENLAIANTAMAPADGLTVGIGPTTGTAYGNGAITSLAPGATDNTGLAVGLDDTSAGAKSGSVALIFQTDGSVSGVNAQLGTETLNLSGNVYRLAAASITAPDVILHVGDGSGSVTELLTVANTDPADGYSEGLEVTALGGTGGDVTGATGTTGDIAAGNSDSSSLSVTISTTAASAGGTVAVSETSDGTGIDTLGTTALGTIDVPVNIAVDNYANPVVQQVGGSATLSQVGDTYTLNFGTVYEGEEVGDNLDVANDITGPADWLSGTLSASGDAAFSDTGLGAFGPLSAGDTTPISIDFNPQSPGVFTQTITVAETDSNASGFNEVLTGQTIVVTGTAYGPAVASFSAPPVSVHRGDDGGSVTIPITISNTAPANGYAENLDAQVVNFGTYVTAASGSVSRLAPGASNDTALSATISDPNAGTHSGEVEIALKSDGTGIDSEGTTSLGNAYVQATLNVYRLAAASITAPDVHVGDGGGSVTELLTVTNTDPADGYSEGLEVSAVGGTGDVAGASGSTGDIAAGSSDSSSLSVTISTTAASAGGTVAVSETSDGTGIDTLGTTALGTIDVNIAVDNYANPVVQQGGGSATLSQVGDTYTLNFGTVYQGEDVSDNLDVANDVTGPSDWLSGTLSASGDAAFSDTGLGAFGTLSAGDTTPISIDLDTTDSGTFNQIITLSATDSNPSGYDAALSDLTIEVTGTVVPCFCRDTLILTDHGEVPVQDLFIGDKIATVAGTARRIKWIGRRSYSGRFIMGRKDILPICIKAGALDDNVPKRDLWISPHHAMYFEDNDADSVLIEAKDLVNGVSIVQAERVEKVEYFHVELDTHDVIIAEDAPSESFIDDDSRGMFHNTYEYRALYPDAPARTARYCAPRHEDGYAVETARRRIALRAGLLREVDPPRIGSLRGYLDLVNASCIAGWAQNTENPEAPVCLDIYAGNQLIGQVLANRYREDLEHAGLGSGRHGFEFTPPLSLAFALDAVEVRRSLDGAGLELSVDARRELQRFLVSANESGRNVAAAATRCLTVRVHRRAAGV